MNNAGNRDQGIGISRQPEGLRIYEVSPLLDRVPGLIRAIWDRRWIAELVFVGCVIAYLALEWGIAFLEWSH